MAFQSTLKFPNPATAVTSPSALYGGGGSRPITSTIANQKPSNPFANQVARNTTGYPINQVGGGPVQQPFGTQTIKSLGLTDDQIPDELRAQGVTSIDPQRAIREYLMNDQIRSGQIAQINAGLSSSWATGPIAKARQMELTMGAAPRGPTGQPLDLSQFGGTGPLGFSTRYDANGNPLPGDPLGESLANALLDPSLLQSAQENKFSVLAQIAAKLQGENAAARAAYRGGAYAQIAAEHQAAADQETQTQYNNFTDALSGLYSDWLGNFNTAAGQVGQYNQDAFGRMMQMLQSNPDFDPFGTKAAAAAKARAAAAAATSNDTPYIPYSEEPPEGWMDPGTTYTINEPTPPTYGITYGPPAGERASSNKKQGVYTIH